jgi:hypothetical protein
MMGVQFIALCSADGKGERATFLPAHLNRRKTKEKGITVGIFSAAPRPVRIIPVLPTPASVIQIQFIALLKRFNPARRDRCSEVIKPFREFAGLLESAVEQLVVVRLTFVRAHVGFGRW